MSKRYIESPALMVEVSAENVDKLQAKAIRTGSEVMGGALIAIPVPGECFEVYERSDGVMMVKGRFHVGVEDQS